MKRITLTILILLAGWAILIGQEKKIELEEIWNGTFRAERLQALRSMSDGKHYTVLTRTGENRRRAIISYDYETASIAEPVLVADPENGIPEFSSYAFSEDEERILIGTEIERIYRRSRLGIYYIYDRNSEVLIKVRDEKIQEPTFSPDGMKVAYVHENDLYVLDLNKGITERITSDGLRNHVINGITDWVYEEEFAFVRAFDWNSEGTRIAFLRFDETEVPEFSMDVYGDGLYPKPYVFKYPKAGEANAEVSLHIYDLQKGNTETINLGAAYYIPRIQWMNDPDRLSVQTINRHQNLLNLLSVDASNGSVQTLLEERDEAYIDITDNLTFLPDDRFIWTSEQDGNNHIYLYNAAGKLLNQVTKGPWEVTSYYGYDRKKDRLYFQSSESGSIYRDIYGISSNGQNKVKLSEKTGRNDASFSSDFSLFINTYSNSTTPPVYSLHDSRKGQLLRVIEDNKALREKLDGYEMQAKEFSTLEINGNDLNMYLIKPADFDPSKEYPLLMFQYSGPGSQQVADRWLGSNDFWHQMLASQGMVIACVDGRGTGLKGRDFKKVTQKELGKYEVEDQIAAAKKLSELAYIDPLRTGIWGWSYGGFMSSNCILKGNDTFEVAIAVAPVTSWRFYDTIYTERYMQTPQENPSGYDENSPLHFADMLKGKYMLVHGSGDDNVHVQNTMRMIEALVQANKPFEWAVYPDKAHGISGGNTRLHLFGKMTRFLEEHLLQDVKASHTHAHNEAND